MLGQFHYKTDFFTKEECELFIKYYNDNEENAYRGKFRYPPFAEVNLNKRVCKIVDHQGEHEHSSLIQRVTTLVRSVNEEIFMFDVDWDTAPHRTKIVKYEGAEKGFWSRHQNVNWISNNKQFKIFASIILSDSKDFEGGDNLYFFGNPSDKPTPVEDRKQGTLCIYPAFRIAQTNPVLSGDKYTLDFLFEGPYWR